MSIHSKTVFRKSAMMLLLALAILLPYGSIGWAEGDWTPITPPDPPAARHGHTLVTLPDGRVMLFGGENAQATLFNDLHTFDGNNWSPVVPANNPPPARCDHDAWLRNNRMYVAGGKGATGPLSDIWYYDLQATEWQEVNISGVKPAARHGHTSTPLSDGSTLIVGGLDANGTPLRDSWRLNPDGTYTQLGNCPYPYHNHTAFLAANNQFLLVFGRPGVISYYDFAAKMWSYVNGGPPVSGYSCSTTQQNAAGENVVFVFGGKDASGNESDVVYEYNTSNGALTQRLERMPFPVVNSACATTGGVLQQGVSLPLLSPMQAQDVNVLHFGGVTGGAVTGATLFFIPVSAQESTLVVNKAGTGTGEVTSNPAGINCGTDCIGVYSNGTPVTLTAVPDADSTFAGWSGDADCSDGQVTVDANKICMAAFNIIPPVPTFNLNVSVNPGAGGTVTGMGINCPGDCSESYTEGTEVGLTANAGAGYQFYGWGGNLSESTNPSNLVMDANKSVGTYFGTNAGTTDNDSDGVSSSKEMGPNGNNLSYDGDGNGVPDYQENRVASLPFSTGNAYATIAVPAGQTLSNVQVLGNPSPTDAPAGVDFPYGFFAFTINGVSSGGCTTATLYLPRTPGLSTYYKYGATPENATNHWYPFMYDGQTGAEIFHETLQTKIVLHFCDGQRGDDDLTTNTAVPDQGGPGQPEQQGVAAVPTTTEWGMIIMTIFIGLGALYFLKKRGTTIEPCRVYKN